MPRSISGIALRCAGPPSICTPDRHVVHSLAGAPAVGRTCLAMVLQLTSVGHSVVAASSDPVREHAAAATSRSSWVSAVSSAVIRFVEVPDQSSTSLSRAPARAKIGAAREVALEPLVQRLADEVRAGEDQQAEGREHGECDA